MSNVDGLLSEKVVEIAVGQRWHIRPRPRAVWTTPNPVVVEAILDGGWIVARWDGCAPMVYDLRSFTRDFEYRVPPDTGAENR